MEYVAPGFQPGCCRQVSDDEIVPDAFAIADPDLPAEATGSPCSELRSQRRHEAWVDVAQPSTATARTNRALTV